MRNKLWTKGSQNLTSFLKKELKHFGNSLVQITLFVVYVLEKELTVGCKCPLLIIMLMVGVRTDVHSRCVFFHVKMWRLFVGRSVCDPMRKRHCLSKKWDFFKAVKAHRPFFNFKEFVCHFFERAHIFSGNLAMQKVSLFEYHYWNEYHCLRQIWSNLLQWFSPWV